MSPELREYIHASSYELKVEALDVIGSLIGKLGTFLDREPINMPSGMLPLSDEYFRRIEAVEFTVKSDDGKEPRNFKKADLVLVGVSRHVEDAALDAPRAARPQGREPADRARRPPPPRARRGNQDRIVGLTIGLEHALRNPQARLRQLGMPAETNYALREHVKAELAYAQAHLRRTTPTGPSST